VGVFIEGRSRTVGRGTAAAAGGSGFYIPLIPGHLVARRDGSFLSPFKAFQLLGCG